MDNGVRKLTTVPDAERIVRDEFNRLVEESADRGLLATARCGIARDALNVAMGDTAASLRAFAEAWRDWGPVTN